MFITNLVRTVSILGAISTLAVAAPVSTVTQEESRSLVGAIVCTLPIIRKLCRKDVGEVNVLTPVGVARGLQTSSTSSRFVVKYASASRWGLPAKATSWDIPANSINNMPPMCPQPYVSASSYSEDCLYSVIYTPVPNPSVFTNVPVLVWIHGGSFELGSASASGLDGAALAKATNSIVVVLQYRLGVLGLVPPTGLNGNTNLAVRDVITSLQFIRQVIPSFGGDINQITVAGQSSGGQMIRALLAAPSASSLFKSAAIHSDAVNYGFYKPETATALQNLLYTNTSAFAACNDLACQQNVAVSDIISAQQDMRGKAMSMYPVTYGGSPIRPFHDGQLLQYTLTGNSFPPTADLKPLMVMTVKDEGAPAAGYNLPAGLPEDYFSGTVSMLYDPDRSSKIVASGDYDPNSYGAQAGYPDDDKTRTAIAQLMTDGYWRCPSWTLSRSWTFRGGKVYAGEFQLGATYPSNQDNAICAGKVCHEDDIYILFGTTPSPTSAQTALTQEIQSRYYSFIRTGVPNPSSGSYATWTQSGSADVSALKLGGTGTRAAEACDPSFWGTQVQYDYQVYGL